MMIVGMILFQKFKKGVYMSIKIYNAHIYRGDINYLMDFLYRIRKFYIHKASEHLKHFLKIKSNATFSEVISIIEEAIKRGVRHPLNIEASIVVYFIDNKIILHFF